MDYTSIRSWHGATEVDRKPLPHLSHLPTLQPPTPALPASPGAMLQLSVGEPRVLPNERSLVPDEKGSSRGRTGGEGNGESGGGRAPGDRLRAPGKVAGGLGHRDQCRREQHQETKRGRQARTRLGSAKTRGLPSCNPRRAEGKVVRRKRSSAVRTGCARGSKSERGVHKTARRRGEVGAPGADGAAGPGCGGVTGLGGRPAHGSAPHAAG